MGKGQLFASFLICLTAWMFVFQTAPDELLAEDIPLSKRFHMGVEYMIPGVADVYAKMGITWAKGALKGFRWVDIEPQPPVGGKHNYIWRHIDRLIVEYQKAGFKNFHIYTEAQNEWAAKKPKLIGKPPSALPKVEYQKYYADYIRNFIERYDGDGIDDMPGLLYPIRYWEIEAEWATFWKQSPQEYIELLRIARKAAKEADPQAKIILVGFLFLSWFDGDFSREERTNRFNEALPKHQKAIHKINGNVMELLKHPDLFDVVEYHSLSDWTEIIGTTKYLREAMEKNGYEKPIWVGDANYSLNMMMFYNKPCYPYVKEQKKGILRVFKAMKKKNHPKHLETLEWFRSEQARFSTKKIICAMGEGVTGINLGQMEELWPFRLITRFTGSYAFVGLTDIKGFKHAGKKTPNIWRSRVPGEPRPVLWTIKMLLEKLGPFTKVKRLKLKRGIYAYHFSQPLGGSDGPSDITVAWYEDGKGQLPGEPEPTINFVLPVKGNKATYIPIITKIGQQDPDEPKKLEVQNGNINLALTECPILIMHGEAVKKRSSSSLQKISRPFNIQ